MSDQLSHKKSVWVFRSNRECPLNHYQLLVYSYMAFQSHYGNTPSLRSIHRNTGMSKDTARSVCDRLRSSGLLTEEGEVRGLPVNRRCWFQISEALRSQHDHFSRWITNWTCYIRQPGIDLTLDQISVYSYIRHCSVTRFRPAHGMTPAYVAVVLGMSHKTVSQAFERLQDTDLIRIDGKHIRTYRLTEEQLSWFIEKSAFAENDGAVCEYVNELPPPRTCTPTVQKLGDSLYRRLGFGKTDVEQVKDLIQKIVVLDHWEDGWQRLVEQIDGDLPVSERRQQFRERLEREAAKDTTQIVGHEIGLLATVRWPLRCPIKNGTQTRPLNHGRNEAENIPYGL